MKTLIRIALVLLGIGIAEAQQQTPFSALQPDCVIPFQLNTANGLISKQQNNRQVGCYSWSVFYTNSGYSALSLTFQNAPDNAGAAGTWVTFAGTTVTGTNPMTAITSGLSSFTGYYPWLRVIASGTTGTGTITGAFLGWRQQGSRVTGGGGGSGNVTHTGSLTLNCSIVGNGGADLKCSVASIDAATGNFTTPGSVTTGAAGPDSGLIQVTEIGSGNTIAIAPADDNGPPGFLFWPARTGFIATNATNTGHTVGYCATYDSDDNLIDLPCAGGGTPGSPDNSVQVNYFGAFRGLSSVLFGGTPGMGNESVQFYEPGGVTNVSFKAGPTQAANPFLTVLRNNDTVAFGVEIGSTAVTSFPNFRIDTGNNFIFNTPGDAYLGFDRDAMNIFFGLNNATMTAGSGSHYCFTSTDVTGTCDTGFSRGAAGRLDVNNGPGGSLRDISARSSQTEVVDVGSLPPCNPGAEGTRKGVNDALTPVALATVVGGGAQHIPVYCDGTNWIVF